MTTVRQRFKTDTFHDVDRLLRDRVQKFWNRYGDLYGDRDELYSDACVAFVEAYDTYNPDRGAFTTHVVWKVNMHLLRKRADAEKAKARGRVPAQLDGEPEGRADWLRDLLGVLGDDAREVVRLVTQAPAGLRAVFAAEAADGPFGVRLTLRSYLEGLGWSRPRINSSFREVREALS